MTPAEHRVAAWVEEMRLYIDRERSIERENQCIERERKRKYKKKTPKVDWNNPEAVRAYKREYQSRKRKEALENEFGFCL